MHAQASKIFLGSNIIYRAHHFKMRFLFFSFLYIKSLAPENWRMNELFTENMNCMNLPHEVFKY